MISETKVVASIKGLKPNSVHGLLVHSQGDLSEGIATLGRPFNPQASSQSDNQGFYRFAGDLGNVKSNENGEGYIAITHPFVRLFGESNVYGRSCVVYNDMNNSQTGLNDAEVLAAGLVGHCGEFKSFAPS
jgi:Cu-Zn family superoxide dismutase